MARPRDPYAAVLGTFLVFQMLVLVPLAAEDRLLTLAVAAGLLVVAWVGLNAAGRRPLLARPVTVGWREKVVFVALPAVAALVPPVADVLLDDLVVSGWWVKGVVAADQAVTALVMLWVLGALVRSGLVSVFPWLARQTGAAFVAAGGALGRTIPLLIGVVAMIFFSADLWRSVGRLAGWGYVNVLALFALLSAGFLHSREHLDLRRLATFDTVDEVAEPLADTPLALDPDRPPTLPLPAETPLGPQQEHDLRLVSTMARVTVVTVIGLAVFAFFVVLGAIAVNADVVRAWVGGEPHVLLTLVTTRYRYDLTVEHLRVAGFLAVFSAFYAAVASRTDPGMREHMHDTAEEAIREACAARLLALHRFPRAEKPADATPPDAPAAPADAG